MITINEIIRYMQTPILAVVVFMIGFVIAKLFGGLVDRLVDDFELNKAIKKVGPKLSLKRLGDIIAGIIYSASVYIAVGLLGIRNWLIIILLIGAGLLILLSFTLNIRDFFPNIIAGRRIKKDEIIIPGKNIKTSLIHGKVERVGFLETHIKDGDEDIYVQNRSLTSDVVIK